MIEGIPGFELADFFEALVGEEIESAFVDAAGEESLGNGDDLDEAEVVPRDGGVFGARQPTAGLVGMAAEEDVGGEGALEEGGDNEGDLGDVAGVLQAAVAVVDVVAVGESVDAVEMVVAALLGPMEAELVADLHAGDFFEVAGDAEVGGAVGIEGEKEEAAGSQAVAGKLGEALYDLDGAAVAFNADGGHWGHYT